MQFIESFLTLYFRINSMNRTLLSAFLKVLLLVRLYHLNRNFMFAGVIPLNDFYEFLGLEKTELGDAVGWSSCNGDIYWIDFNHHRLTLDDGMEIYVIDMVFEPIQINQAIALVNRNHRRKKYDTERLSAGSSSHSPRRFTA